MRASQFRPKYDGKRRPRSSSVEERVARGRAVQPGDPHAVRLQIGDGRGARARADSVTQAAGLTRRESSRQLRCLGHGTILQNDA